jgi:hypothetical protein
MLAAAGSTRGILQTALTAGGIVGTCLILLANLGARSWHSLRWKPVKYGSPGSCVLVFFSSCGHWLSPTVHGSSINLNWSKWKSVLTL